MRRLIALIALGLGVSWGVANAQSDNAANKTTVVIAPSTLAPDLGKLVAGTSATTFHMAAGSGLVTVTSGNGFRLTSGAATSPLVTITCKGGGCKNSTITVTLSQAGISSGRPVTVSGFNVTSLTGATVVSGSTSGASPLVFTISPLGVNGTATFKLGLDSRFPPTGAAGVATWSYTAQAIAN
jgi:hypothetical protein